MRWQNWNVSQFALLLFKGYRRPLDASPDLWPNHPSQFKRRQRCDISDLQSEGFLFESRPTWHKSLNKLILESLRFVQANSRIVPQITPPPFSSPCSPIHYPQISRYNDYTTSWIAKFRFQAGASDSSLLHSVQTRSWAYPARNLMGANSSIPRSKVTDDWGWPLIAL
jgi:hypothetical protein